MKKMLLMLMAMIAFGALIAGFAEEAAVLPITFDVLTPAPDEGFISDNEYIDETLHVRIETMELKDSKAHVAWVEIKHPSQLRTALSSTVKNVLGSSPRHRTTSEMAKRTGGAVIAINGDFFASSNRSAGYIVRMGEVLREKDTSVRDSLLIDDSGDFHLLVSPSKEDRLAVTDTKNIINAFSFGPAMIIDGEAVDIRKDYQFASFSTSPRTAIGQIGQLNYVMVVVDGRSKTSVGVTIPDLQEFMLSLGCQQAFALDGGGTATMSFGMETYNEPSDRTERPLSDIIYFASGLSKVAE